VIKRMNINQKTFVLMVIFVAAAPNRELFAEQTSNVNDLYVVPVTGDDANDGRAAPVRTIVRAIRLAQPGDTVHLAPGVYYETADLTNKHGLPGKPITLDGHGAVLDGSEPVTSKEWQQVSPGLYRRQKVYKRTDDAIVGRWFLLWDGKMQRMQRCSKGPSEPLKPVSDLQPGEWTYVKSEDAFYLKLSPDQLLDDANIRYPARSSAVVQSIRGSHLTVRNITGTHVYNDGYNVHGAQRNLVFENIAAIECGDDGFSAHEDADCRIDGFTSIRNATGLCDTGTSQTHYRNVFISQCDGFDLYFIGQTHSVENAIIESSAARTLWVDGNRLTDGSLCEVSLKNVIIRRMAETDQELRIGKGGRLRAHRCTFLNLNATVTPGGSVDLRHCFLGGDRKPEVLIFSNTMWHGDSNVYDFKTLRVAQTSFYQKTFADFQKLTGSEANSRWAAVSDTPTDVGANPDDLQHLTAGLKEK
jgi:hypothetical protein